MLFNSIEYLLLFLPVTLLVFQVCFRGPTTEPKIMWLVLASLVFYGSWNPKYLSLIVVSILVNFAIGKALARNRPSKGSWLLAGICFNLGLLGYFKYTGFFLTGLNSLGLWLIPIPEITLPLAISFFTFQQIAYLVDVSRGDCKEYQFSHYALFVLFFPQLIAGPIVHHKEIMPQFHQPQKPALIPRDLAVGLTFISVGLFKKVVLADSLAQVVDPVFDLAATGEQVNTVDALLAMFGFSFQIYFDFSAYTDMAIGSARLFGIKLPENFRSPYKSRSVIEIWHRWHMTLSRFLRDYLYFPLGGNRNGPVNRYRNLLITMLLGGLWHGAAWTFIIWGGLHGLFLCINHAWRNLVNRAGLQNMVDRMVLQPLFILITFTCWSVAMAVFRAADINAAWAIIRACFIDISAAPASALDQVFDNGFVAQLFAIAEWPDITYAVITSLMVACSVICWLAPNTQQILLKQDPVIIADNSPLLATRINWQPTVGFALVTALLLSISLLSMSSISSFIYFQF